jgi:hypothetical protein
LGSIDSYGFVMYCLPNGSVYNGSTSWTAFAFIGGQQGFFQNGSCSILTTVAHEMGHMQGYGHANRNGEETGDRSSMMGRSLVAYGGPRYCFDGHKYSLSGWMNDRKIVISQQAYYGRLVAFVDKLDITSSSDKTLLQLTGAPYGVPDVFVLYNRKKDFNDGVRENGDLVTVTQQDARDSLQSNHLSALSSGQRYTIPRTTLSIHVCSFGTGQSVDYAWVSVYDTRRGQSSQCSSRVAVTTSSSFIQSPTLGQGTRWSSLSSSSFAFQNFFGD